MAVNLDRIHDCRKHATFPAKLQNIDDMSFIRTRLREAHELAAKRRSMIASTGKANTLGDRSVAHVDPGSIRYLWYSKAVRKVSIARRFGSSLI